MSFSNRTQEVAIPFEFNWLAWRVPAGPHLRNRADAQFVKLSEELQHWRAHRLSGASAMKNARVAHIKLFHDGGRASALLLQLAAAAL